MMKQFLDLKAKHPDAVMLFRCGDFYETYSTDAVVASEILGITLTKRANGKGKTIEMAGFPHHALDTYLPKLIRAGKRVAICDQLEDPKLTKKLVKRGITELVTPGVSINDNVLNYRENNFLAAVHFGKGACGVAFLDISTGEFLTAEGPFDYVDKLLNNFAPQRGAFRAWQAADVRRKLRQQVLHLRVGRLGVYRDICSRKAAEAFRGEELERLRCGASQERYHRFGSHPAIPHHDAAYADRACHFAGTHRGE